MKKIFAVLITLGLLLAPISTVQAQSNNEVQINLNFADDIVYVNASDQIVLYHGWAACTRGHIYQYLSAVRTTIYVDDVLVSVANKRDQHWGPITKTEGWSNCIVGDQNTGWAVIWRYPLGTLTPGEHEVYFKYILKHSLSDGADYDGNGSPDIISGVLTERTITIVVSE